MVECQLPKLNVAGSSPVSRSMTETSREVPMFPKKILLLPLALFLLPPVLPASAAEDAPAIPALSPLKGSRLLDAVGYDPATETLAVVFRHSIDVFLYDAVPPEVFSELMASESRGVCFVRTVKPNYAGRAVPGGATNALWRTPSADDAAPAADTP